MTKLSLKINRKYKKFSCNQHCCLELVIGMTGLLIREPKRFRSSLVIVSIYIFSFVFFFPLSQVITSAPTTPKRRSEEIPANWLFSFPIITHQANYKIAKTQGGRWLQLRAAGGRDSDPSCLLGCRPSSHARPVNHRGKSILFNLIQSSKPQDDVSSFDSVSQPRSQRAGSV